ncbi:hypothetical protein [Bacillus cereus group sp. BcHK140]|uniref:hypothetical protein n=1 Tax=Bacillus cereus group sp. BcHK140 TaxID=3018092 RepID=UPI0022E54EB1|nr:hypothetical protein [Bacillus cereus group sp. BcHK140]MDA1920655.1 hypothetical protein [Bacillus cereus group sp. BcHK140]
MAKYYGYCYNEEGRFTEMIPLEEKAITEKQTFYREETKEIVIEEKLCELHQSIMDGTYVPDPESTEEPISKYDCPDCVMAKVDYETIKVPYEEDVVVGYEPDIPMNCTLEVCPDLIYDPVFKDGKWIKLKPELLPQPEPGPSEMDKLKTELEVTKAAMAEFIMQQTLKGM